MGFARTFTERVAAALLSLAASAMTIGGVALAGLGATLRQASFDMEGMPVIAAGLMALGAVLAVSGGASLAWARGTGYSGARLSVAPGARVMVLVLLLFATALPLALAAQLGPLAVYWRDIGRLAAEYELLESANGPSALVFVPATAVLLVPALEVVAAGVVALSCGLLLALVVARAGATAKLSAIGVLLAAGLTIASWVGAGVTEQLAPSAETLILTTADPRGQEQERALALLQRHRAVVAESAWTLSWAWAAVALLAAGTSVITKVVPGGDEVVAAPSPLHSRDQATRAEALLDAAERLHRTTPPVRRF